MSAVWQCALCEAVNTGGRTCEACGAPMTRRSAAMTSVRGRVSPVPLPPDPATPLPRPVQRAISREPIDEDEWPYAENDLRMIPVPGGCVFVSTPRRTSRRSER